MYEKAFHDTVCTDHAVLKVVYLRDKVETLIIAPVILQCVENSLEFYFLFFDLSFRQILRLLEMDEASNGIVADDLVDNSLPILD